MKVSVRPSVNSRPATATWTSAMSRRPPAKRALPAIRRFRLSGATAMCYIHLPETLSWSFPAGLAAITRTRTGWKKSKPPGDVSRIRPTSGPCTGPSYGLRRPDVPSEKPQSVELALVYDTGRDKETVLTETAKADEPAGTRNSVWPLPSLGRAGRTHREQRDALLATLTFPFPDFAPGNGSWRKPCTRTR